MIAYILNIRIIKSYVRIRVTHGYVSVLFYGNQLIKVYIKAVQIGPDSFGIGKRSSPGSEC